MIRKRKRETKMQRSNILVILGVLFFGFFIITNVFAQKPVSATKDMQNKEENAIQKKGHIKENESSKYDINDFQYSSEGKRDPFEAILLKKAIAAKEIKTTKVKKVIAQSNEYELEAMKLVGVMKSDKGMIAMMEDSQGKGVFFRKNDPLNRNMWIADISAKDVTLAYKLKGEIKKVVVEIPEKK